MSSNIGENSRTVSSGGSIGKCWCKAGTILKNKACVKCVDNCAECTDITSEKCTVWTCLDNKADTINTDGSITRCNACKAGYFLEGTECVIDFSCFPIPGLKCHEYVPEAGEI